MGCLKFKKLGSAKNLKKKTSKDTGNISSYHVDRGEKCILIFECKNKTSMNVFFIFLNNQPCP